jgi:uncharacterized protein (TIGR01777 family)
MRILIAGATGFIGQRLVQVLNGNQVTVVGRDMKSLESSFKHAQKITWEMLPTLDAKPFDAIINLCGYNIAASRWSQSVKNKIIDSRVKTTTTLVNWAIEQNAKPHLICANAVGIYGMQDSQDPKHFDESSPINFENPVDFLSEVGVQWQKALQAAIDFGMPVTSARFGVVLGRSGGMLKKLMPSFYLGLGAILGDGKQVLSWVDLHDLLNALLFLLQKPQLTGAFNITSPNPVTQAEFAKTLAQALHRPLFLRVPAFVIRALLGEMGECLLLKGQRVLPAALLKAGYVFQYPQLDKALRHELAKS